MSDKHSKRGGRFLHNCKKCPRQHGHNYSDVSKNYSVATSQLQLVLKVYIYVGPWVRSVYCCQSERKGQNCTFFGNWWNLNPASVNFDWISLRSPWMVSMERNKRTEVSYVSYPGKEQFYRWYFILNWIPFSQEPWTGTCSHIAKSKQFVELWT